MAHISVNSEKVIEGRPEDIYAVLSDYKGKHTQILTPNFQDYAVERGGRGDGTIVTFRLQAAGRERPYRMHITEPVKGKVLKESDANSTLVTTWTVSPLDDGQRSRVQLDSQWEGGNGVNGFFERTFAPMGMRRIYASILSQLAQSVQEPAAARSGNRVMHNTGTGNAAVNMGLFVLLLGGIVGLALGISAARRTLQAGDA